MLDYSGLFCIIPIYPNNNIDQGKISSRRSNIFGLSGDFARCSSSADHNNISAGELEDHPMQLERYT